MEQNMNMRVVKSKVEHSKGASPMLKKIMIESDIALLPKSWVYRVKTLSSGGIGGELIYIRNSKSPTWINMLHLNKLCSKALTVVKMTIISKGGTKQIIIAITYLPWQSGVMGGCHGGSSTSR